MEKSMTDFAPLPLEKVPQEPQEVTTPLFLEDLSKIPLLPRRWLVRDAIPFGNSFTAICGDSNCGKTFALFSIMLSVAMGFSSWQGQSIFAPSAKRAVVYLYSEGLDDVLYRVYAWLQAYGLKIEDTVGRFFPIDYTALVEEVEDPTLIHSETCKKLKSAIEDIQRRHGVEVAMVAIDTLNGWMGDDEDSARKMAAFFSNLTAYIAAPLNTAVVIIHHTGLIAEGKTDAREIRPRGSSAFRGKLDSLIMCMGNIFEGGLQVFNSKNRSGKRGLELFVLAREVVLDSVPLDEDGNPTTSLAVDDTYSSDEVKRIYSKKNLKEKNNVTQKTHEDFTALNIAMSKKELSYTYLEDENYRDEEGYPHSVYSLRREDIKTWLRDFYFKKRYEEQGYSDRRINQELSRELSVYEGDKPSSRFIGRLYKAGIVKFDDNENWSEMYTVDRNGEGGMNKITWQVIHVGFCSKEKA